MKIAATLKVASCLAAGLLLAGCPQPETANTGTDGTSMASPGESPGEGGMASLPTVPEGQSAKVAFITNNASDFWTIARKGVEKADAELDTITTEFKIPPDGTAADQQRIVDDLMATGVKGFAISPVDPENQTDMINTAAKQALVLTQDSDAPKSDRACYVGTDNHAAGMMAGELIKKAIPGGGKIMVFVGKADAQNANDRYTGIKDALKGSNIEIIDLRTDDADRTRAKANVSDTLVKYPDIAGLVGLWSYNGPAILSAVKDANKTGKVKIIAFDEEEDTLMGVKNGAIAGTVVQQPYKFGEESIRLMDKILHGDTSAIPADKHIYIPTRVIDKGNVDEFMAELKKMRS